MNHGAKPTGIKSPLLNSLHQKMIQTKLSDKTWITGTLEELLLVRII